MKVAQLRHDRLLRNIVESYPNYILKTVGGGFRVAFDSTKQAPDTAFQAQNTFRKAKTRARFFLPLLVRMTRD